MNSFASYHQPTFGFQELLLASKRQVSYPRAAAPKIVPAPALVESRSGQILAM